MNFLIDKLINRREFFLLVFCCLIASCTEKPVHTIDKKELDLLRETNKLIIVRRQGILHYVDSVYRTKKNKDPYLRTWRLGAYADYCLRKGINEKANEYADSALAIINRQDLTDSIWTGYYFGTAITKANALYALGRYSSAIDTYFKVKHLADKTSNRCNIGDVVDDHIGIILFKQQKYDDAKEYFKLGLEVIKDCSGNEFKARQKQELLDNIGECFDNEGNTDSALTYYRKALRVIESEKFNRDPKLAKVQRAVCRGVVVGNIAQLLVKKNKLDSAEQFFKENIRINGITYKNESKNAQFSQMYLAGLYQLRAQYPKMKTALADLRKNLDTLHNVDVELGWRKLMAQYYGKINSRLEELKFTNSYLSLKDSLDMEKIVANASDIKKELKAKGQQMDFIVLQNDNKLSHLYLWITIALSAMALTIVVLIYYYYRRGKKNIQSLMLLNREIGEQKDKIEFARVELEKSNTDKERILKVVAHDLRNPISGIDSLVSTVMTGDMDEEDEWQNLTLIKKASANSLVLINELLELDLSPKQVVVHKEPADIIETVKQCIGLMQLIADKKNQKIVFTSPTIPLIIGIDKVRIERMMNNLVGNAIKFSPAGEKIAVTIEPGDKTVLIIVKDNGIGIPPEMQTEIFNTLGNLRRKGTAGEKSFGFGLSICKQIAEMHGGKIGVESEPGNGARFYVELPG